MIYICSKCGGKNVQHAMWVELNTNTPIDDFGTWNNGDNNWCNDCEEHTTIKACKSFALQCWVCSTWHDADDVHEHANGFVCESCWDERLRTTE